MKIATVEEEYKKNKELREDDINNLQKWIEKQLHLPPISELLLIVFLHSCYWSIEKTKSAIDKFYTYRNAWPDFFANRDTHSTKLKSDMEIALFTFLPKRTPQNYKIFYTKLIDVDLSRYIFKDLLKIMDMCLVSELMQFGTCDGLVIICDFMDVTIGHILKMHVTEIKKFLIYLQEALPVRLKAMHFTNVGAISDLLMPMIKPFVRKELIECIYISDSLQNVFKVVPQECFPKDFGGTAPTISKLHEQMQTLLIENEDYFLDEEKLVSNEARRDRRPSYMDKDFGIGLDGSFKKLEFD